MSSSKNEEVLNDEYPTSIIQAVGDLEDHKVEVETKITNINRESQNFSNSGRNSPSSRQSKRDKDAADAAYRQSQPYRDEIYILNNTTRDLKGRDRNANRKE